MKDERKRPILLDIVENGDIKSENNEICSDFIKTPFSLWKAVPLRSVGRGGTSLNEEICVLMDYFCMNRVSYRTSFPRNHPFL